MNKSRKRGSISRQEHQKLEREFRFGTSALSFSLILPGLSVIPFLLFLLKFFLSILFFSIRSGQFVIQYKSHLILRQEKFHSRNEASLAAYQGLTSSNLEQQSACWLIWHCQPQLNFSFVIRYTLCVNTNHQIIIGLTDSRWEDDKENNTRH